MAGNRWSRAWIGLWHARAGRESQWQAIWKVDTKLRHQFLKCCRNMRRFASNWIAWQALLSEVAITIYVGREWSWKFVLINPNSRIYTSYPLGVFATPISILIIHVMQFCMHFLLFSLWAFPILSFFTLASDLKNIYIDIIDIIINTA